MLIIQDSHNNNMPHKTSNHGGHVNNWEAATLEKKVFQVTQLSLSPYIRVIYIFLNGIIIPI